MNDKNQSEVGLLVTNHLNLMFSLAAGLIMPPSGFGDKYYRDPLGEYPGWIPFFVDKVPRSAIDVSIEEARHLMPVIAAVDLAGLSAIDLNNARRAVIQCSLLSGLTDKGPQRRGFLVRGPIPAARIRVIRFRSDGDMESFRSSSELRSNVPVNTYALRRNKTRFSRSLKRWPWLPERKWPGESIPVHAAHAVGGILAMLHQIARKSSVAADACRAGFNPQSHACDVPGLNSWMRDSSVEPISKSLEGHMLWGLVTIVAENRMECSDNDLEQLVVDFFDNIPAAYRRSTAPLSRTLKEIGELGGSSIEQLWKQHRTPLGRAVILFFLRRECQELLDFRHDLMSDSDWVYAAILFGARSGWLRLPLSLRGSAELEPAVSYRMAAFHHQLTSRSVDRPRIPEMPTFG